MQDLAGNSYTLSDIDNHVTVGKFTCIAGAFKTHGASNHPWIGDRKVVSNFPFKEKWQMDYPPSDISKGNVIIGNDVWIGESVTVLSGVTIGDGAILGARAVVAKDIPPYAVVVGNPAVVKKYRYTPKQIKSLLKIQWWLWPNDSIKENIQYFKDIDLFIKRFG